jgi:hypothetical protein
MKLITQIKDAIKDEFGMKINYWNDLNKDKSIRKFKIDLITKTDYFNRENTDQAKTQMYADFITNKFGIENVIVTENKGLIFGYSIVFKIKNN